MPRQPTKKAGLATLAMLVVMGCNLNKPSVSLRDNTAEFDSELGALVKTVQYTDASEPVLPASDDLTSTPPLSLNLQENEPWPLSLDSIIRIALSNSTVMHQLGARVIQAPELTPTVYGPSLRATDPRFGVEAALSAFDASFATRAFYEKNDRALNNALLGGGTNFFVQDLWRIQTELRKQAATGTVFALRQNIEDDLNNAPQNIFGTAGLLPGHAWGWNLEAEARQPLLQGNGVTFNRIAGPSKTPGVVNGVMIARINTNIGVADFQLALRDYVSNVENAYWELYFAYHNLDAMKRARDRSLNTWRELEAVAETRSQGQQDKVAQAAEQYYYFQEQVENGLGGRLLDGTRDFNGSTGGTFQGVGGVYVAERRLRLIMGLPINDGRLIRPMTPPCDAKVVFDWRDAVAKSLTQRTEIARQHLRVRRRELELIANREFLLPKFDFVGRYRWRGLGNRLYDPVTPDANFDNVNNQSNEWQLGLELTAPFGYRQAHSAVHNSELELARERAILTEIERQIIHDLSNSFADQERAYRVLQTAQNRRYAADRQLELLTQESARAVTRQIDFNSILDAERRAADAETSFYRALMSHAVSLKNVYLEMGSLFEYCNIHFSEEISQSDESRTAPAPAHPPSRSQELDP